MGLKIELSYECADEIALVVLKDLVSSFTKEIVELENRPDRLADYEKEDLKNHRKDRKAALRLVRHMTVLDEFEDFERSLTKLEKKLRNTGVSE